MARRQAAEGQTFRAVILKELPDGTVESDIYGPYGSVGAARAMRTNRLNSHRRYGRGDAKYTGEVHRAVPSWEVVPDDAPNAKEALVAQTKNAAILALPMEDNDANANTVGEYLSTLLFTVLDQEEGFSGKRPFGNSGWTGELEDAIDGQFTWDELLDAAKTIGDAR